VRSKRKRSKLEKGGGIVANAKGKKEGCARPWGEVARWGPEIQNSTALKGDLRRTQVEIAKKKKKAASRIAAELSAPTTKERVFACGSEKGRRKMRS